MAYSIPSTSGSTPPSAQWVNDWERGFEQGFDLNRAGTEYEALRQFKHKFVTTFLRAERKTPREIRASDPSVTPREVTDRWERICQRKRERARENLDGLLQTYNLLYRSYDETWERMLAEEEYFSLTSLPNFEQWFSWDRSEPITDLIARYVRVPLQCCCIWKPPRYRDQGCSTGDWFASRKTYRTIGVGTGYTSQQCEALIAQTVVRGPILMEPRPYPHTELIPQGGQHTFENNETVLVRGAVDPLYYYPAAVTIGNTTRVDEYTQSSDPTTSPRNQEPEAEGEVKTSAPLRL